MNRKKAGFFLIALAVLAYLAVFFTIFGNQDYYHSGISFTLRKDGFHILKVAPQSAASMGGVRGGMIIHSLNGLNAVQLYHVSESRLQDFLSQSSRLFKIGQTMRLVEQNGAVHEFTMEPLSWKYRFYLFNSTVLSNLIVALLFVLCGIWLLLIGNDDQRIRWFFGFTLSASVALSLSFFDSYWSWNLLFFRFVALDVSTIFACFFLIQFINNFPLPQKKELLWFSFLPMILVPLKYTFMGLGVLTPFGFSIYLVHLYLAVSLTLVVYRLIKNYKKTTAGGRRRLRWVFAGLTLSLLPYLLFSLSLLFRSTILVNGASLFNYVAGFGLLMFPLFVTIGTLRFNLFDIDRFINRFAVLFFLFFTATAVYSLVFLAFFEAKLNFSIYLTLLTSVLLSPLLYKGVDRWVSALLKRGYKDKHQILLEMEQELIGVYRAEDVYPIVTTALVFAFDPEGISFSRKEKVPNELGSIEKVLFRYRPPLLEDHGESPLYSFTLSKNDQSLLTLNVEKKRDEDIYTRDDMNLLTSATAQISKALEYCDLYHRLEESLANESYAQRTAILTLAKLTEYRDEETGRHLERIQAYTRLLALCLKDQKVGNDYLTNDYIDALCLSSILHDIGKVGIPDQILLKPGKLTGPEFDAIKKHTLIGGKVLEEAETLNPDRSFLAIGKMVAYNHHEKWDGSGYPFGLKGEDIPFSARIVALADVYDALRSTRPYKEGFTHQRALEIIFETRGSHFDPLLVDAFISIETQISAIERN